MQGLSDGGVLYSRFTPRVRPISGMIDASVRWTGVVSVEVEFVDGSLGSGNGNGVFLSSADVAVITVHSTQSAELWRDLGVLVWRERISGGIWIKFCQEVQVKLCKTGCDGVHPVEGFSVGREVGRGVHVAFIGGVAC